MVVGCLWGRSNCTEDPTRLRCSNTDLSFLIVRAFALKSYEFSAPGWMRDRKFDVEAVLPAGTTKEQFLLMFRALLQERFEIKYHRGEVQAANFDLTVAKGGPKLTASSEGRGVSAQPTGAFLQRVIEPPFHAQDQTTEDFATRLSGFIDAPVINRTGLSSA